MYHKTKKIKSYQFIVQIKKIFWATIKINRIERGVSVTTIILFGSKNETAIGEVLFRALSKYGGVQQLFGKKLYKAPQDCVPKFLVYELDYTPKIEINKGIFIFKNKLDMLDKVTIPNNFISIVGSDNTVALSHLMKKANPALCCGMSPRDTLSISSHDFGSAVISLQRAISSLDGKIVEPHDVTITLTQSVEQYPLLAAIGVLLLSGLELTEATF